MDIEIIRGGQGLKCYNCALEFDTDLNYKAHFKSDFHRYNLKRKMVDLPPATYEEFHRQFISSEQKSQTTSVTDCLKCMVCRKEFGSHQTYKSHLQSRKHQEKVQNYKMDEREIQFDFINNEARQTTLEDISVCLFCDASNDDLADNIRHMERVHGFFICEEKYITNTQGLIQCLARQINEKLECPYCENAKTKGFADAEGVKKHMIQKGHCFMNNQAFFELYCEYYDFTPAIEEAMLNKATEKAAGEIGEVSEESDEEESEKPFQLEGEEQQQCDSVSIDSNIVIAKQVSDHAVLDDSLTEEQRTAKQRAQEIYLKYKRSQIECKAVLNANGEVELPSGKIIGHRSLSRYYDQYYRPISSQDEKMKAILGEEGFEKHKLQVAKLDQQRIEAKQTEDKYRREADRKDQTLNKKSYVNSVNNGLAQNKVQKMVIYQSRI